MFSSTTHHSHWNNFIMDYTTTAPPPPPLPDLSLHISPPSDSGNHYLKNQQPQIYGSHLKRGAKMGFGIKRSIRAPRMRWTTTLHAHFVHAVQLLGGHESTPLPLPLPFSIVMIMIILHYLKKLINFFFFFFGQGQHQNQYWS